MNRIALGIEYDGHAFHGWQAQHDLLTIERCLTEAVSTVADESVKLYCAGRTDAGVHALGQVVHFDVTKDRPLQAWTLGVNAHLPKTISVQWAQHMDHDFHARFSALARCYSYVIYNVKQRPALLHTRVMWYQMPLDILSMQKAASFLLGENDFSSFRSSQCESKSPMRCVHECSVIRQDHMVIIRIKANAFLHHMVRNIVGVLVRIGAGHQQPEWMRDVLLAKDRREAAETASPHGLYLSYVEYPKKYVMCAMEESNTKPWPLASTILL